MQKEYHLELYLEIACFNAESAIIAGRAGANRIELCQGLEVGGLTPEPEVVKLVLTGVSIPVFVMIRPRGGDFVYSNLVYKQMKNEITLLKTLGVKGFVFGILDEKNQVDIIKNSELVKWADPLPCSFHRAFDRASEPHLALESVIASGFKTILTSGHQSNAVQGAEELKRLIELAKGRIEIMPGGGVRSENLPYLIKTTGASYYHSSALLKGESKADEMEIRALKDLLNSNA